jgi:DNA-binding protein H-NS
MDNINSLSLKELKELQSQVAKAIASFEDRKKKIAFVDLQEMARAKGFTLEELTGISVVRRRAPAVAKYANPADATDTWSGRGRKPRWFLKALASGRTPEDLSI